MGWVWDTWPEVILSAGSAAEPGSPTEAGEQEQEAKQAQDDVQFRLLWGEGKSERLKYT